MRILIIIPTYNEKENIRTLLQLIIKMIPDVNIVVVDDGSPDGTAREVEDFAATSHHHIQLIKRSGKRGLGVAYKAGFLYGLEQGYDIVMTMDADMSHNPEHLPQILTAIKDNDVVIGSRYIRDGGTINWGIGRILLSWCANKFARIVLGLNGHDLTSGYRAYRHTILEAIDLDSIQSNGYSFLVEVLFRAQQRHARISEVPIIFFDRTMGESKISKQEIYLGAFTLLRLRWRLYHDTK